MTCSFVSIILILEICRWVLSLWYITQLHIYLLNLQRSGMLLKHSLTAQFIVIILIGKQFSFSDYLNFQHKGRKEFTNLNMYPDSKPYVGENSYPHFGTTKLMFSSRVLIMILVDYLDVLEDICSFTTRCHHITCISLIVPSTFYFSCALKYSYDIWFILCHHRFALQDRDSMSWYQCSHSPPYFS